MHEPPPRILQISTRNIGGGAEKIAWELFRAYQARGYGSKLVVGYKLGDDPDVMAMPHHRTPRRWSRFWWRMHHQLQPYYGNVIGVKPLCRLAHALAEPRGVVDRNRGIEDFHYPGTRQLFEADGDQPDIIHGHNLHGGYFDLPALARLSRQRPVLLTLHDAWLLSGHCAHAIDCERWKTGCGQCPDLDIYPSVRRDATAFNWQRKQRMYAQSRLYLASPCHWLMRKVEQSMLAPAVVESRVIPYGVDVTTFRPADQQAARHKLGIDPQAVVFLFAARGVRHNPWKDYRTMHDAVARVAARQDQRTLLFLALGEEGPSTRQGRAEIRFVPFVGDREQVARYYQAADVYLHAARAETFPNAILEALACGTPVVATVVGGIGEQVRSLTAVDHSQGLEVPSHQPDRATGILVPAGDCDAMAQAMTHLLRDDALRRRLGDNAAADARKRFSMDRQVDDYLAWYGEIMARSRKEASLWTSPPTASPQPDRETSLVSTVSCKP